LVPAGTCPANAAFSEDVIQQRRRRVELLGDRHAERLELPPEAFEHPEGRPLGRQAVELCADPGVGLDRVVHAERDRPDRVFRRDIRLRCAGQDRVRGRDQQLALVRHVPVDRACPGAQLCREGPEGQAALARDVEHPDGRVDDALRGEGVLACGSS
jgi:hypothetical protein